ncbi:hypothetical protein LIER_00281 [Lithospermum erythrorhizon]|uniref:CRIB domain-containing protein n=1 Tax=Lithospermum erythrorhizon TaxID=34254 RepID=A0AAV3NLB2_LITER
MGTKVKGLLRGLRYISQIFDEEKKHEIQIGLPTDVKHVAHIGSDGPSLDSPSWMKGYESPGGDQQSTPSDVEDTKRRAHRDHPDVPKSTRRHSPKENSSGDSSPKKEKVRHSRRHHLKDSESTNLINQDGSVGSESNARDLLDVPKKSRRKKTKDSTSSRASKSRGSELLTSSPDEESS